MADLILALALLLGIGFATTRLAAALRMPHSVFLVVIGIIGGVVLKASGHATPVDATRHFPDIVLYCLLPLLVFESAYNIDAKELRKELRLVATLAVPALLLSAGCIGFGLHAALGIPLTSGLLFGALISATDPVAVVALFKEVGAPRRLSLVVEGESLLNDATAIVLFNVLLASSRAAGGVNHPALTAAAQFVAVALGGAGVGVGFIVVVSQLLRMVRHSGPAQIGLTVASAYGSFLVADHLFHVSGVMATLTVGLYLGDRARLQYNRHALHGMHVVWEFLSLAANTLVFLAVGLIVDLSLLWRAAPAIPVTLALVYATRAVSVAACVGSLNATRAIPALSWAHQAVIAWGGLRGGLALALVLLLPQDFPQKQLFLALGTAVVLATLILNGLTISPLMRKLALDRLTVDERVFLARSIAAALQRVFSRLQGAVEGGELSERLVEELRTASLGVFGDDAPPAAEGSSFDVQRLLLTEQRFFDGCLEEGILSPDAYVLVRDTVAERLEAFRSHGADRLAEYPFALERAGGLRSRRAVLTELTAVFEALLHLRLGFRAAQQVATDPVTQRLLESWRARVFARLDRFQRDYPHVNVAVQSAFATRTVAASAQAAIEELHDAQIIGGMVYSHALQRLEVLQRVLDEETQQRLHPTVPAMLAEMPLFAHLPAEALLRIESALVRHHVLPNREVIREGDPGSSLFILLSGVLEVRRYNDAPERPRPRLFPGSYFGEMSLLLGVRRSADVVALVDSELGELSEDVFRALTDAYPRLRNEVEALAAARRRENASGSGAGV